MKANWDRHDHITRFLFKCESTLLRGDFVKQAETVLPDLKSKFDELANEGIANSHGLDHFLQVAMAWITTYLGKQKGEPCFRATVSRYLPNLNGAILVKPCLVKPGWCRAPQPTISLDKDAVVHGLSGKIGHTGVSMTLDKILYCRPRQAQCVHYISIDSGPDSVASTVAALCIPLSGKFEKLRDDFLEHWSEDAHCTSPNLCVKPEHTQDPTSNESMPARWVLNIESVSEGFDKNFVKGMGDEFADLVNRLITSLDTYQKERDMHLALERSSSLLALATNTLKARPAYRALLREVSNVCDGADVTLHLRDLFDRLPKSGENKEEVERQNERNRARCSVFVTGVGENYGDFLVNERIGLEVGQIGWALSERKPPNDAPVSRSKLSIKPYSGDESEVLVQYIVGEEIAQAMREEPGAFPFKQLMPNTFLNVTVPIFFHDLKIGVINIEWDREHLKNADSKFDTDFPFDELHESGRSFLENEYLRQRIGVVYRMADYLSLVIDYFDDLERLAFPDTDNLNDEKVWRQLEHDGALRRVMRYYVGEAMKKAVDIAGDKVPVLEAEKLCLRDLVDAVGYFLASATDLRILVSLRRTKQIEDGKVLEQHVYHWLQEKTTKDRGRKSIEIVNEKTVLATCAFLGVPLFGSIKTEIDGEFLYLDKTCKDLLIDPLERVHYEQAGPNALYEVGVPLVFGKNMLGTFDLEQFNPQQRAQSDPSLSKLELCSYLQWARAISFLIAYIEDTRLQFRNSKAFERFVLLCAQLIAEVPVEPEHFMAIATHAFREIIPVTDAAIHDKPPPLADNGGARNLAQMRFRGGGNQCLSWRVDESAKSLLRSTKEAEPGKTVAAMMTSYHALIENLPRQELGDNKFLRAIERILTELDEKEADLLDNSRGAGEALVNVFDFLHQALGRHLGNPLRESDSDKYAWFLHMRKYDSDDKSQYWVCDPNFAGAKEPFSYCYTQEVTEILEKLRVERQTTKDVRTALSKVLEARSNTHGPGFQKVLAEINSLLASDSDNKSVVQAITSQISKRRPLEEEIPSFTKSVADMGHVIVVPDINRSPNRSARGLGWFWSYTYTVVGVPFELGGERIAVLNVFRRRKSAIDNNFFRIEEREVAQRLADKVDSILAKLVISEEFKKPSDEMLDDSFATLRHSLETRSVGQSRGKTKLIVVRSPFARSEESFEVISKHVFGERAHEDLRNPVRLRDGKTVVGKVVLHRIEKNFKNSEEFKRFSAGLPSIVEEVKYFFLFVADGEDLRVGAMPVYLSVGLEAEDSLLQRPIEEDEALYRTWVMGQAMDHISPSNGGRVLARSAGKWTHDKFKDWVVAHGVTNEKADLFQAGAHLRATASWRPTESLFCLNTWETESAEEGQR